MLQDQRQQIAVRGQGNMFRVTMLVSQVFYRSHTPLLGNHIRFAAGMGNVWITPHCFYRGSKVCYRFAGNWRSRSAGIVTIGRSRCCANGSTVSLARR